MDTDLQTADIIGTPNLKWSDFYKKRHEGEMSTERISTRPESVDNENSMLRPKIRNRPKTNPVSFG